MDVHQKEIVVCVLTGMDEGSLQKEINTFSTHTRNLYELLEWLEERQVTHIAMESTGIFYWKPVPKREDFSPSVVYFHRKKCYIDPLTRNQKNRRLLNEEERPFVIIEFSEMDFDCSNDY
jgi:hypothetical protein